MRIRQKVFIASLGAAAMAGAGLLTPVLAHDSVGQTGLAAFLAGKFNVKQTDVESALTEYHQQEKTEMQKTMEERLTQAVTDGKLTTAQKDAITTKQKEVEQKMVTIKALTSQTERRTAMEQLHTELETWATTNNIDQKWLRFGIGKPGHGMRRGLEPQSSI